MSYAEYSGPRASDTPTALDEASLMALLAPGRPSDRSIPVSHGSIDLQVDHASAADAEGPKVEMVRKVTQFVAC